MLKRMIPCCLTVLVGLASICAAESNPAPVKFKVDSPTAIPGTVLQPGAYTLRVVDHLSDRYILRVEGPGLSSPDSFLGIPNAALKAAVGKVSWSKGSGDQTYLKGWNFAEAPGAVEFVYPKEDAVAIAKANHTRVAAIDPASEGRVTNNGLSKEDMQMVTLWLLSPTHVGPGDTSGGIKAERYQQVASLAHKPVVASLPHTASSLPLVMLLGFVSACAAAGFRLRAHYFAAAR